MIAAFTAPGQVRPDAGGAPSIGVNVAGRPPRAKADGRGIAAGSVY
jgi:hypothetical protein